MTATTVLLAANLAVLAVMTVVFGRQWQADRQVARNLRLIAQLLADRPHTAGLALIPCAGGHLLLVDGVKARDWTTMHSQTVCQPVREALP